MSTHHLQVAQKLRGESKRKLIAQAYQVRNSLYEAAVSIDRRIEQLKKHEINEWEMAGGIHDEVLQLFHECGLTELMAKFAEFMLAQDRLERSRGPGMASETGESPERP